MQPLFGADAQNDSMTPQQVKMGRAALGWSSRTLALQAGVAPNTVTNLETGKILRPSTLERIRAAFEKAGLKFTKGKGTAGVVVTVVV